MENRRFLSIVFFDSVRELDAAMLTRYIGDLPADIEYHRRIDYSDQVIILIDTAGFSKGSGDATEIITDGPALRRRGLPAWPFLTFLFLPLSYAASNYSDERLVGD